MPIFDVRSEEFGELQRVVDAQFRDGVEVVSKMDLTMAAEVFDLCDDLREVVDLLPAGTYDRQHLADQMNSILTAHGWGYTYGTVE